MSSSRSLLGALALVAVAASVLGLAWFVVVLARSAASLDEPKAEEPPPAANAAWLASATQPDGGLSSPEQVREVVRGTRSAGRDEASALRERALASRDPLVAANALRALGRLRLVAGDPELTALIDDPRPRVRQEVVLALGASGEASAVATLAPLLDSADATLRPLVIQALGRLPGDEARELVSAIAVDPSAAAVDQAFARTASN